MARKTEKTESEVEDVYFPLTDAQQRARLDALLAEVAQEQLKSRPRADLPTVLGEYRAVEGKPGIYMRPMCMEVEAQAIELYETLGNGSVSRLMHIGMGIAASVLYRIDLPQEFEDASAKIIGFVRGTVEESEVFRPLTQQEVGRLFKNSTELDALVLNNLELGIETALKSGAGDGAGDGAAPDPNA